jgi:hypothetical protein
MLQLVTPVENNQGFGLATLKWTHQEAIAIDC